MENYFKYLHVTPVEEEWGLYVNTVGHTTTPAKQSYPDNKAHPPNHTFTWNNGRILDGHYLVYITKGRGIFESSKTAPQVVSAGTCFFLFPGVWHRYKPDAGSGWEEYWMGFKGYYATQLMERAFSNAGEPFIHAGPNGNLQSCYRRLLEAVRFAEAGYPQVVAGIALQILGIVHGIARNTQEQLNPTAGMIAKARFLLQENMESPVDMEQVAKQLPMGYSNFRKAFKKYTGQSPVQYLLHLRLSKAEELLASTTLSVNDIALHTGFDSIFYFSKFFRRKNGMSPTEYRDKMANNGKKP